MVFAVYKILLVLFILYASTVIADAPSPAAKYEIAHLLSYLQTSGCQFNRNGTWYSSAEAVSHLNNKYNYLQKRGLVPTSEAFIERAASKSSMSSVAYRVKCGSEPEINSADWFRSELDRFRQRKQ
jgi:hypothetical protein